MNVASRVVSAAELCCAWVTQKCQAQRVMAVTCVGAHLLSRISACSLAMARVLMPGLSAVPSIVNVCDRAPTHARRIDALWLA